MGAAESHNPIRNMDKRTARRQYKDDFVKAIVAYRKEQVELNLSSDDSLTDLPIPSSDLLQKLQVCVRKRPIFKHEIVNGEFDIVTCIGGKMVVAHDAKMHKDMRRQFMNHNEFKFDAVFKETAKNEDVYLYSALPLVKNAIDGTFSTCLVYGQTGSGKTFTMSYIYERAAQDIFTNLENYPQASVSISFLEIAGDNCFDLLNSFAPAQLLTGHDEGVYPYPVVEPIVHSAEELYAMILHGCSLRATAATGVHGGSSRSHAILRIYIQKDGIDERRRDETKEGVLTLVDLAGSEYGIDSMYHSAERRKEGAAINASLMALKECLRARAVGEVASRLYRNSKLTMALKSSFTLKNAATVIIATVSPASKDTEHTLSTLRHACIMDGQAPDGGGETRFLTGGVIKTVEVGEVNVTAISRQNIAARKNGDKESLNEPKTSNGNFSNDTAVPEMTEREKAKAQRIAERKALARLSPAHLELLLEARSRLRNEPRQSWRLQRYSLQPVELVGGNEGTNASEGKAKRPPRKSNPIKNEPWKDIVEDLPDNNFEYNINGISSSAMSNNSINNHNRNINDDRQGPFEPLQLESQSHTQYQYQFNENISSTANTPRGEEAIFPPPDRLKRIQTEANNNSNNNNISKTTTIVTTSSSLDSSKLTTTGKLKLLSTLLKQCQFHESHINQILTAATTILSSSTTSSLSPAKHTSNNNTTSSSTGISKSSIQLQSSDMYELKEEEEDDEIEVEKGAIISKRNMIRQQSNNRQSTGSIKPATPTKSERKSINVRPKNNSSVSLSAHQTSTSNGQLHSPPSPLFRSNSIVQCKASGSSNSNSQTNKDNTLSYSTAYQQLTPRQAGGISGDNNYNSSSSSNIPLPPSPKVIPALPRKRNNGATSTTIGSSATTGTTSTASNSTAYPPHVQVSELEQVMRDLQSDGLTDASRYGLQKRLAKLQAIHIREKKRVEQNQREEELKMRDESKGSNSNTIASSSQNVPPPYTSNSVNNIQERDRHASFSESAVTNGNIIDNNNRNKYNNNNYPDYNDHERVGGLSNQNNSKRSTANLLSDILDEPRAVSYSRNEGSEASYGGTNQDQVTLGGGRRSLRGNGMGGVSTVAPFANEYNWENDLI